MNTKKTLKMLSSTAEKEVVRELNSMEHELEWITIKSDPFKGNKTTRPWSRSKGSKIKTVSVTEQNYPYLHFPVEENERSICTAKLLIKEYQLL